MRTLKIGTQGEDVKQLQIVLSDLGYDIKPDGYFGQKTKSVVQYYQKQNRLTPDGVVGYKTYQALGFIDTETKSRELHLPDYLMLHCTASRGSNEGLKADDIIDYHVRQLGWGRPGYHHIIEHDGTIVNSWDYNLQDGYDPYEIAYGAKSYNPYSIHICYIGGIDDRGNPKDTRTYEQAYSMEYLVKKILDELPDLTVLGHNQVHHKACPSFWVPDWLRNVGVRDRNIIDDDKYQYRPYLMKFN